MNTIQKIAKNISFLFISQVISYIFGFFYVIYTARYLGSAGYGILSLSLSLTGIFGLLADLGLSTLITRELSRDHSLTSKYLVNVVTIKVLLSLVTFFIIFIIVNLFNFPQETVNVVSLMTIAYILTSFSSMFYSIFQAHERMELQSLGQILSNFLTFIGVLIVIYLNLNIYYISLVYLVSSLIVLVYSFSIYINYYNLNDIKIELNICKFLILQALPLSLFIILSTLAFKIDTLMLSVLKGNDAVGLYSAPYRLIEFFNLVPVIVTTSIFPIFSRFYVSSQNSLKQSYVISFKYLMILSIPIAVGTTLLADQIVLFLFGNSFIQSINALKILIWVVPFIFLIYLLNMMLISINKQNIALKINLLAVILNITLNLIIIPKFSFIGASVVTLVNEVFLFTVPFYYISKFVGNVNLHRVLIKSLIASAIMAIFIVYIDLNLFLEVSIAASIYLIVLILLKTFEEDYPIFHKLIRL